MNDKELLFSLLDSSNKVVALTGAGVSTLSGIPDFRSSNGLYSKKFGNLKVEDLLDIDFFMSHPEEFFAWSKTTWYTSEDFKPNIIHKALSELEKCGKLNLGIFTQNIDFLHQKAQSKKVYELHGSLKYGYCINCHKQYPYSFIEEKVQNNEIPLCENCNNLIKPDIVFYGENLDQNILSRAFFAFEKADLALVLGSSLIVNPASSLPYCTVKNCGKVIIVNRDSTYLDKYASLKMNDLKEFAEFLLEYFNRL